MFWLFSHGKADMSPVRQITAHTVRKLDKDTDSLITNATQIDLLVRTKGLVPTADSLLGKPPPVLGNVFLLFKLLHRPGETAIPVTRGFKIVL